MTRQDRDPCPLRVDPQPRADKAKVGMTINAKEYQ